MALERDGDVEEAKVSPLAKGTATHMQIIDTPENRKSLERKYHELAKSIGVTRRMANNEKNVDKILELDKKIITQTIQYQIIQRLLHGGGYCYSERLQVELLRDYPEFIDLADGVNALVDIYIQAWEGLLRELQGEP